MSADATAQALQQHISEVFSREVLPKIEEYIAIPAKSPAFDAQWQENGHIERAIQLLAAWAKQRTIAGLSVEIIRLPGRTPLLLCEIPAHGASDALDPVLMYGHYDKQPEMVGWSELSGPWQPRRDGDKLYGRGGADDGYSTFAALTAIEAAQKFGLQHARIVVLIEGCEESGSYDLPAYVDHLSTRIGTPSLVVALDSGAGDYQRLWMTTSLRGMAAGTLRVSVLREGVHSGAASGVVPSSFRIARALLDRLENAQTGEVLLRDLHAEIPAQRVEQAGQFADILGEGVYRMYPWFEGTQPMAQGDFAARETLTQMALAKTWHPTLSVTGADGLPPIAQAGNVLRPHTELKLSVRLPPTISGEAATAALKHELERDPPHGASVHFEPEHAADGWHAPVEAPWLLQALQQASQRHFGAPAAYMGEGGTIPFMAMLGEKFPKAQFVITGVLGPQSNAHGPNEFLHLPTAEKLTLCVADLLQHHVNAHA